MENFKMVEVKDAPRVELHNQLGLTGCEISIVNFQRFSTPYPEVA